MNRLRWWLADRLRPSVWPSTEAQHGELLSEISALHVENVRLQAAIDEAHGVMNASSYVGGPSEREAWQTAMRALGSVVTQHTGTTASAPQHAPGDSRNRRSSETTRKGPR
jgi:hypothetical protein